MFKDSTSLADRLLKTGWQSWSWGNFTKLIKLPTCNYPPSKIVVSAITVVPEIPSNLKPAIKGWCSWYAFGQDINEQKVLDHCDWLRANPQLSDFKHILIDDGWQTNWGDWLHPDILKFPHGLKDTAQRIRDRGFIPGIWVAPFLVSPISNLAKEHPEWLVSRNNVFIDGLRLSPFDRVFSHKKYILNVSHPSVTEYLDKILDFLLIDCGFKFIKLDFLYGIYFSPNLNIYQADEYLRSFLLRIKKKYPDVYTIGCGCPLVPAVGAVDSMRIGPDVSIPALYDSPLLKRISNRFLYKQVVKCIKRRAWTKEFWNVDLDVFLCNDSQYLSDKEILVLRDLIKKAEGNIFLGDDLTKLPKSRVNKFFDFNN